MKIISYSVSKFVARKVLTAKMNSPHIFFAGGVAAVLTGTVLACRSTLKLEAVLDDINVDTGVLASMKTNVGTYKDGEGKPYTEQDYYRDFGYVYAKSAIKIGRLYGPALVIGGAGIAALTGSHVQLTRRNTALTVTLAAVTRAFEDYRARVRAEVGEDRELEIHRAIREEEVEVDGKKEKVKVTDPNGWSPYARFFDETSTLWVKSSEMNRTFLQCQQNWMNEKLRASGHVFLNEVYDALGLERSRAGAVVGWVVDGDGDGYIDFGLFEATSSRFINNMERSIILDFNVDGVIYDKIKE